LFFLSGDLTAKSGYRDTNPFYLKLIDSIENIVTEIKSFCNFCNIVGLSDKIGSAKKDKKGSLKNEMTANCSRKFFEGVFSQKQEQEQSRWRSFSDYVRKTLYYS